MYKKIIILMILFSIFGYFSLYYLSIYEDNMKIIKELKLRDSWKKNKTLTDEIKKIKKEKENFFILKEKSSEKNEVEFWNVYFNVQDILENIKKNYLDYKFKEIKDSIQIDKEGKTIFNKSLLLNIPAINLSINSYSLQGQKINKEMFFDNLNKQLTKWVIRYPNKDIIQNWITLLYWHSSQPLWTKKDYSFFKKIPLLNINNEITLKSEKKDYIYKVIDSKQIEIAELSLVQEHYDLLWEKLWTKYIMLITCYPINTTNKRWIVIWELK